MTGRGNNSNSLRFIIHLIFLSIYLINCGKLAVSLGRKAFFVPKILSCKNVGKDGRGKDTAGRHAIQDRPSWSCRGSQNIGAGRRESKQHPAGGPAAEAKSHPQVSFHS
jgi:hypothetical protein